MYRKTAKTTTKNGLSENIDYYDKTDKRRTTETTADCQKKIQEKLTKYTGQQITTCYNKKN